MIVYYLNFEINWRVIQLAQSEWMYMKVLRSMNHLVYTIKVKDLLLWLGYWILDRHIVRYTGLKFTDRNCVGNLEIL